MVLILGTAFACTSTDKTSADVENDQTEVILETEAEAKLESLEEEIEVIEKETEEISSDVDALLNDLK